MRTYRLLLWLFPASFRAEYGEEMCAVFAARRRDENAVLLWLTTLLDVLKNAMQVHADVLRQDLRWTLRILRKSPGFTFTAISVAALGIGANTAAFALLDHVLLRPLPFLHPEQLVMLYQTDLGRGYARIEASPPNFQDWRAMSKSFGFMAASVGASFPMNLSGQGDPQRVSGALVDSDVFPLLGVQPAVGRGFTAEDEHDEASSVVLFSNRLATALFGRAADAVGRSVRLESQSYAVAGVMPAGFAFPDRETELWLPLGSIIRGPDAQSRANHILSVIARLRPGASIRQARADMDIIAKGLERTYPKDNRGVGIIVLEMRDLISPQSRVLVLAIFGAAFCVLLIACTNLANLLLARAIVRRQEVAVRFAIGAGRERLIRQLLTENLLLAIAGGLAGIGVAFVATPALTRLAPDVLPVSGLPSADLRVSAFAAVITILTSLVFGVGPVLRSCHEADINALRSHSAAGRRTDRLRAALVLAEVAGTVTLLVGAGLLAKAMWRVRAVDPGFRAEGVLTLQTALPIRKYSAESTRREFYSRVLGEAKALPGVKFAGYVTFVPLTAGVGIFPVLVPGIADDPTTAPRANIRYVAGDYFTTMGIPLLRGRPVNDRDLATSPLVTTISESLARRFWRRQDAVGRHLSVAFSSFGKGLEWTVVGVVGDVAFRGLERSSEPQIYFPAAQLTNTGLLFYAPKDLVIRAMGDPLTLAPALRRIIHQADPEQAISNVRLLEEVVSSQTASRRDQLRVLCAFAAIAFLLAAEGIHGLLSFAVSARTQEIGVRMALGAVRGDILGIFLRQGLALGALGVASAMPLAYAAARGMGALLFGVPPGDPPIYMAAAALALAMTIAGSLRPAIRAASVDAATTIRAE